MISRRTQTRVPPPCASVGGCAKSSRWLPTAARGMWPLWGMLAAGDGPLSRPGQRGACVASSRGSGKQCREGSWGEWGGRMGLAAVCAAPSRWVTRPVQQDVSRRRAPRLFCVFGVCCARVLGGSAASPRSTGRPPVLAPPPPPAARTSPTLGKPRPTNFCVFRLCARRRGHRRDRLLQVGAHSPPPACDLPREMHPPPIPSSTDSGGGLSSRPVPHDGFDAHVSRTTRGGRAGSTSRVVQYPTAAHVGARPPSAVAGRRAISGQATGVGDVGRPSPLPPVPAVVGGPDAASHAAAVRGHRSHGGAPHRGAESGRGRRRARWRSHRGGGGLAAAAPRGGGATACQRSGGGAGWG